MEQTDVFCLKDFVDFVVRLVLRFAEQAERPDAAYALLQASCFFSVAFEQASFQ